MATNPNASKSRAPRSQQTPSSSFGLGQFGLSQSATKLKKKTDGKNLNRVRVADVKDSVPATDQKTKALLEPGVINAVKNTQFLTATSTRDLLLPPDSLFQSQTAATEVPDNVYVNIPDEPTKQNPPKNQAPISFVAAEKVVVLDAKQISVVVPYTGNQSPQKIQASLGGDQSEAMKDVVLDEKPLRVYMRNPSRQKQKQNQSQSVGGHENFPTYSQLALNLQTLGLNNKSSVVNEAKGKSPLNQFDEFEDGPYTCTTCNGVFFTSQNFATHAFWCGKYSKKRKLSDMNNNKLGKSIQEIVQSIDQLIDDDVPAETTKRQLQVYTRRKKSRGKEKMLIENGDQGEGNKNESYAGLLKIREKK